MPNKLTDWATVKLQWLDWRNRKLGSDAAFVTAHGLTHATARTHFARWRFEMRAQLQTVPPQPRQPQTPTEQVTGEQSRKAGEQGQTEVEEGFKASRSAMKARAVERLKELMEDKNNPAQSIKASLAILDSDPADEEEAQAYAGVTDEALMARLLALAPAALKARTEKTIQDVVVPKEVAVEEKQEEKTV